MTCATGMDAVIAARCRGEEAAAEQQQAAKDWNSIMTARAAELKPGGKLVIVNFCVSAEGHFLVRPTLDCFLCRTQTVSSSR